jgi:uncharacterized UPF0160 family protein
MINKKTINLLTHSGLFHADDIFATALLTLYFKNKEPKIKLKYKRSIEQKDIDKADIVYDIGRIHNPKKLRFDHHQNDASLVRKNDIPYAAFGLVFRHFGPELIGMISDNKNKKFIQECFDKVEKNLVLHIDAMDNGVLTYKQIIDEVDVLTIDNYFRIARSAVESKGPEEIDKKFFELVKLSESIIEDIILYSVKTEKEKEIAIKFYKKSKDKRVIVCDVFFNFNFNKFPEPLIIIYPDLRGNWSAKVVEKGDEIYDARIYFPKSWRGLNDEDLEKVTEVKGSMFCHKSGFLAVNKTKEGVLEMVYEAFKILKIK